MNRAVQRFIHPPKKFSLTSFSKGRALQSSHFGAQRHFRSTAAFFRSQEQQSTEASAKEQSKEGKSDSAPPAADPSLTQRLFTSVKQEVGHAKEYFAKWNKPIKEKRNLEEFRKKVAAQKAAQPAAPSTAAEVEENLDVTDLVLAGAKQTVWDQRLSRMREKLRSSSAFLSVRRAKRNLETSENRIIQSTRGFKESLQEKVADVRENYETSQHPMVWKVKEVGDKVFGETETGWALGELMRIDPDFTLHAFLEDMEEYMIPIVVEAFLAADQRLLRSVCEEEAARGVFASLREREVKGEYWDKRILDLRSVDFVKATMLNDTPLLVVSFVCQHVNCIRNSKGVIVQGSESDIRNVFYNWVVRRDFTNENFDWKIVQMSFQQVHSLV